MKLLTGQILAEKCLIHEAKANVMNRELTKEKYNIVQSNMEQCYTTPSGVTKTLIGHTQKKKKTSKTLKAEVRTQNY